ncbi:uncharacterized protein LOC122246143 isoform X2 [Penaeus japonicus]|uniref:uncharacterized protein LOC122246143 isoform X2 n=1 Tax=Penaeus japonicus TaxID=27405 RepID=UPI001C715FA4|nr:uncharacterized protein LOC122246143 isoform X2 [Penaeus japonicus]
MPLHDEWTSSFALQPPLGIDVCARSCSLPWRHRTQPVFVHFFNMSATCCQILCKNGLTVNHMESLRPSDKDFCVFVDSNMDFLATKDNKLGEPVVSREDSSRTMCFKKGAMSGRERLLLTLLLLLAVLLLAFLLLIPLLSVLTLEPRELNETTVSAWQKEKYDEPAINGKSTFHPHKEGKIWLRTERLLPTITLLYDRTTRPVTLYQPETYEDSAAGQRWYFKAVQGHDDIADVEMFLHNSVQKFQLALKNPRGSTTVHHIALQPNAKTPPPSKLFLPATPVAELTQGLEAPSDCLVVNLSDYLNDWVAKGSEFSIFFETPRDASLPPAGTGGGGGGGGSGGGGRRGSHGDDDDATTSPQHLRHSLLQPVVTVMDRNTTVAVREIGSLGDALRETLAGRMAEAMVTRGAEAVATLPPLRRRRRDVGEECQMSMVSVSLDELGLNNVVYPTTVDMKFCQGSCHVIDDPAMFSTNALMRVKYKFLRSSASVPSPQCTPTYYKYLPFIVWQSGKLRKIGVSDLDATICGCR